MTMSKLLLTCAAAALASSTALAAHNNGSPLNGKLVVPPPMKLKNEAYVTGNGNSTSLPQFAFTPIDAGTVLTCKKACTAAAEVTAQVQTAGGDWAICITVDGSDIECQYQGVQSGPSSFVVGNASGSAGVGAGGHTFQTQLYAEGSSATYQFFNMHYSIHQ